MKSKAAIVGVAQTPIYKEFPNSVLDVALDVIGRALKDAGLRKDDIDSLVVSPSTLGGPPSFMLSCSLAAHLNLATRHMTLVECGGMTATVALKSAIREIESGRSRRTLVLTMDHREMLNPKDVDGFMHNTVRTQTCLYGVYEGPYGLGAPIPYYAMSAQRYMHEFGVSARDIAEVPVMMRRHSANHPDALYRDPLTVDEVLGSKMMCPPIHLLECSAFAAGAAAVVVAHPEEARSIRKDAVDIVALGEYHDPSHFVPLRGTITSFISARKAAAEALAEAGIGPMDLDVAEVYGVFAATELMLYESLGFCEPGKGAVWLKDGRSTYGGDVVMCPTGGRVAYGHPAGTTPLFELIEITRQLRGEAAQRQVPGAGLGMVHSEHGMLNGSMVLVMKGAQA